MKSLLTIAVALLSLTVFAQTEKKSVVVGSLTSRPNALLIVNPPNADQGVLLPQLSTGQRMSLKPSSPAEDGLIVFDTNFKAYYYWSDGAWVRLRTDKKETTYYTIDPLGFQELKPNKEIRHNNLAVFEAENTFVTVRPDGAGEQIIAPVSLPHGAVMQEVTVYYMDNDNRNFKVYLMRKSFTGSNEEIIRWESSEDSNTIKSQSFSNFQGLETVDLENYSYRLVVVFDIDDGITIEEPSDARQRIYGVRIKYQQ
ncbi:MAG: hypothetical protein WA874_14465 [Chryseosolibacter sp.]